MDNNKPPFFPAFPKIFVLQFGSFICQFQPPQFKLPFFFVKRSGLQKPATGFQEENYRGGVTCLGFGEELICDNGNTFGPPFF